MPEKYHLKEQFNIYIEWRKKKGSFGRFGGGWNWVVGFQLGGCSLILNLLVMSIRFTWKKKKEAK